MTTPTLTPAAEDALLLVVDDVDCAATPEVWKELSVLGFLAWCDQDGVPVRRATPAGRLLASYIERERARGAHQSGGS